MILVRIRAIRGSQLRYDREDARGYLFRHDLPLVLPGQAAFRAGPSSASAIRPRIDWRPFELNPDLPWEGAERAAYMAAKFGDTSKIEESQATLTRLGQAVVSSSVSI